MEENNKKQDQNESGVPLSELIAQQKKETPLKQTKPVQNPTVANEGLRIPTLNEIKEKPVQPKGPPQRAPLPGLDTEKQRVQDELITKATEVAQQHGKEEKPGVIAPEKKEQDSFLKPLRTYKDDLANAINRQKSSLVSVVAAESERRAQRTPPHLREPQQSSFQKFLIPGISILFLVLGGGALYFAYTQIASKPNTQTEVVTPTLIFADEQSTLDLHGLLRRDILVKLTSAVTTASDTLGSVRHFSLVDTDPLTEKEQLITAQSFFDRIDARAPGTLMRSLKDTFVFGVHAFDGNIPLLILKTDSYENAFSGMLDWEKNMNEDLAPLFGPVLSVDTTSSSTPLRTLFKDEVTRNRDARILRDQSGKVILLYSFPDRNTIIITTNESTFTETLVRLNSN